MTKSLNTKWNGNQAPKEPWEDVGINSPVLDNLNNNCPVGLVGILMWLVIIKLLTSI